MSETKYIPGILCKYIDIELLITLSLNFVYTRISIVQECNLCTHCNRIYYSCIDKKKKYI